MANTEALTQPEDSALCREVALKGIEGVLEVVKILPPLDSIPPHMADPSRDARLRKEARQQNDAELGLYITI